MRDRWQRLKVRLGAIIARQRLAVVVMLVLCSTPLVLFGLLDARLPDDHDLYYTRNVVQPLQESTDASLGTRLDALAAVAIRGEASSHPPLAQTWLLVAHQLFGTSLRVFRLSMLPFLLLLLWATYRAGRDLVGHRFGLLAAFVVGTMPAIVNYSRKWEPGLPNAAIAALTVFLVIRIIRRPGALLPWVALGVVQGLRMYVHPVVLPDVVLWFVAVVLGCALAARGRDRPLTDGWPRGVALCVVAFLGVAGWYLGLGSVLGVSPGYDLASYLELKSWMLDGEGAGSRLLPLLAAVGKLARDLFFVEWMPQYAILIAVPGLVASFTHPLLRERSDGDTLQRNLLIALVVPILAQLPLAVFTTRQGCFTSDWIGLAAPSVLLTMAALHRFRRVVRRHLTGAPAIWITAVVLVGGIHAYAPLLGSLIGPDPYARPARDLSAAALTYSFSEWGHRQHTHHLAFRGPSALDTVTRFETGEHQSMYCVWNLEHHPESEAMGCSWSLETPGADGVERLHNPWAAAFAGRPAEPPQLWICPDHDGRRHHVVRLVTAGPWQQEDLDDRPADHAALDPRCLQQAIDTARELLAPPGTSVVLLEDHEPSLYYDPAADRDTFLLQPRDRWFAVLTPKVLPTRYLMRSIHIAPARP